MQPRSYPLEQALGLIKCAYALEGEPAGRVIDKLLPVGQADGSTLAWIDPARGDKQALLNRTQAGAVVCDASLNANAHGTVLIKVADPRLTFIKLATALFEPQVEPGIHPTAVIHPEAQLADDVYIGPLTYIGKAVIGAGSVLHGNAYIYDNVRIGARVVLQAGCVIGVRGYSLAKDEAGDFHGMPHLGGVVIEDDVEIQALSVVDCGTLGDTVIGRGTKINSHCYVAHNCQVGARNFIAGHTVLSGSVTTGRDCWFGPNTVVRDRLRIGDNCFIGVGSVVVSDLEENARVMGNPARPVSETKSLWRTLKRLRDADPENTE